jgi:hypothetical protein
MPNALRTVEVDKDSNGNYSHIRIVFGPHYFLEIDRGARDSVSFTLGATHHGFRAEASQVSGELEQMINEIRRAHPNNRVD